MHFFIKEKKIQFGSVLSEQNMLRFTIAIWQHIVVFFERSLVYVLLIEEVQF